MNAYENPHARVWYHATRIDNVGVIEREGLRGDLCIDETVHLSQRDKSSLVWMLQFDYDDADWDAWSDSAEGFDPSRVALYRVSLEGVDAARVFEGVDDEDEDCAVSGTIPPQNLERIR